MKMNFQRLSLFFTMVGLCLMLSISPSLAAESTSQVPEVKTLEDLVATIKNEEDRAKLLGNIQALIEVRKANSDLSKTEPGLGASLIVLLSDNIKQTTRHLGEVAAMLKEIPYVIKWLSSQIISPDNRNKWLSLIFSLVIILGLGWAASTLSRKLLSRPRLTLESHEAGTLLVRASLLLGRTILDLFSIAVFAGVSYGLIPIINPVEQIYFVALSLINGYLVCAVMIAILKSILVPAAPSLRLFPIRDIAANYLFIWCRRLVLVGVIGYFIAEVTLVLGIPSGGHLLLLRLVGLLVIAMLILIILQNRQPVSRWLEDSGRLASKLAGIWHAVAIVYALGLFSVWLLGVQDGFEFILKATVTSVVVIGATYIVARLSRRALEKGFEIKPELKALYPTLERRTNRYLPGLQFTVRIGLTVLCLLSLLQVWGIDILTMLETPLGQNFVKSTVSIALIIMISLIFWEGITSLIERFLAADAANGGTVKRSARVRTLLPLLQKVILVVLCIMVLMTILSEIGINIAPLMAGAGVVGLAIGFGSQQLVKDIIAGIFILVEDTLSVGDWVDLGGQSGTVEALSIRSLRLRDASANVHTIPFGSVERITNMTRDYSYAVIEAGVGYNEDADNVIGVLHEIGADLQADPEFTGNFMEPLSVLGVDRLADSAVVIKARIKTLPGTQWAMRREFQLRMKKRFDELGIEIPFPHTKIYFADDKQTTPAKKDKLKGPSKSPSKGVDSSLTDAGDGVSE